MKLWLSLLFLVVTSAQAAPKFHPEVLSLKVASGRELRAQLWVPEAGEHPGPAHRYPVLLIFGGFQEAAKVLTLVHPEVPVILASFDYPFDPPRRFEFPGSLRFAPEVKRMVRDTVEGIQRLRTALVARPDVDSERMTVLGASLGSPFVLAAAAEDAGIQGVVLVHGFGKVRATAYHQMAQAWVPHYGFWACVPAWLIAAAGWTYLQVPAPEDQAQLLRAEQKVLMVEATEDRFIPQAARASLWKALSSSRASVERIAMPGDHLQPGSDRLIRQILDQVSEWMKRAELL